MRHKNMGTATCLLAILCCVWGSPQLAGQRSTALCAVCFTQQDSRDIRVTISLNDVDVREAIKQIARQAGIEYSIAPDIQGTVVADMRDVPLDVALRNVLYQVHGTFRVEGGVYEFIMKEPTDEPTPANREYVKMPEFRPGEYSTSYEVRNKALFLTANRTWGHTSDLLVQAADRAGYPNCFAYAYGDGFALVLPVEGIQRDGRPMSGPDRFHYKPNMGDLDFRRIAQIVHGATGSLAHPYRVLVLLVSATAIEPGGSKRPGALRRSPSNAGLPDYARSRKWKADPKLTVLVYEFGLRNGKGEPVLRRRGEPGIGGRDHVIFSGLWKAGALH